MRGLLSGCFIGGVPVECKKFDLSNRHKVSCSPGDTAYLETVVSKLPLIFKKKWPELALPKKLLVAANIKLDPMISVDASL